MEGDLNHHPPPPQSGFHHPELLLLMASCFQIPVALFECEGGCCNFGQRPLDLWRCQIAVLHITTVFSFPQGDQKSQSAKAKKSSAGDGKGSLTRIFKMVKLFVLFSWRRERSHIDNRFCPYRLTVSFLLSCLSDEISSGVSNQCETWLGLFYVHLFNMLCRHSNLITAQEE